MNADAIESASLAMSPQAADADQGKQAEGTTAKLAAASLESLAAELLTLSPSDRQRLVALLGK